MALVLSKIFMRQISQTHAEDQVGISLWTVADIEKAQAKQRALEEEQEKAAAAAMAAANMQYRIVSTFFRFLSLVHLHLSVCACRRIWAHSMDNVSPRRLGVLGHMGA